MSVVTVKPIELRKGKSPLPSYRFTTDETVRMRDREPTVSGVIAGDGIMVESSDGNDFILLESDTGSGANYLQLES